MRLSEREVDSTGLAGDTDLPESPLFFVCHTPAICYAFRLLTPQTGKGGGVREVAWLLFGGRS